MFAAKATSVYLDIYNFNYILIAIAVGSVFLIATIRSYILAIVAVLTSILVLDAIRGFTAIFNIPVFTLPFNIITLSFLYALRTVTYPYLTPVVRKRPEDSAEEFFSLQVRVPEKGPLLVLPFSGEWTVWQGFNGKWTHQGYDRYAYDFLIKNKGQTYSGEGKLLTDYYAFGKPVLSPCKGRVIKVISDLEDNPPLLTDANENWGNCLVIDTLGGYFVEISHFAQHSITVEEGEWVEMGTHLGACGNSGYSPQPHIHIQVQQLPELGSQTLPFAFKSYVHGRAFHPQGLPAEEQAVSPIYAERELELKTAFVAGKCFRYKVNDHGKISEVTIQVSLQEGGETFLQTEKGKLFFSKDDNLFYFYRLEGNDPYLKYFMICAPRFPLIYAYGMTWHDTLPYALLLSRTKKSFYQFMQTLYPEINSVQYQGVWQDLYRFNMTICHGDKPSGSGSVQFHRDCGFERLTFGNIELNLISVSEDV